MSIVINSLVTDNQRVGGTKGRPYVQHMCRSGRTALEIVRVRQAGTLRHLIACAGGFRNTVATIAANRGERAIESKAFCPTWLFANLYLYRHA
jgi:hypothetical protein